MLTFLDFTNKPVKHYQLFPHSYLASTLPLTEATNFSYHFLIDFAIGRSFQNFLLNSRYSYQRLRGTKHQQTECFFKLSHHFMHVLYSSGKSWNYVTNFELLFTTLCLLLSYQHIYVTADTICNHPVHLTVKREALMSTLYSLIIVLIIYLQNTWFCPSVVDV